MIQLTPSAAKAISRFIKYSDPPVTACRVSATDDGGERLRYLLRLEAGPAAGDHVIDVAGVRMVVDPASRPLLEGATLDFVQRIDGSGFKFSKGSGLAAY